MTRLANDIVVCGVVITEYCGSAVYPGVNKNVLRVVTPYIRYDSSNPVGWLERNVQVSSASLRRLPERTRFMR